MLPPLKCLSIGNRIHTNANHTVVRLCDVVQSEGRLYLVFEFVDKDLKKYFEACDGPLSASLIKVMQAAQEILIVQ